MHSPSASLKSDDLLLHDLRQLVAGECRNTASIVEHIAEVDRRKLYRREGFPSMFAYCVDALHLSESAAYKRIHAARAVRRYPEILTALADGRIHLSAICLISPYLTRRTAPDLLAAATHRRRFEITEMLARRFPQPERLAVDPEIRPLPQASSSPTTSALAPEAVGIAPGSEALGVMPRGVVSRDDVPESAPGEGRVTIVSPETLAPGAAPPLRELAGTSVRPCLSRSDSPPPRNEATPLSADRFELRFVVDKETHELLKRAQDLLSHAVPSRSIPEVFRRSLVALISQTEKRIAGAGGTRRTVEKRSMRKRYVPAAIRRAVWERDGGRCTFVSETGRRCESREFLQFDHVDPVARGGKATVEGIRLRCRAHNQYEAERVFGTEFMERKRKEAQGKKPDGKPAAAKDSLDSTDRLDPSMRSG